MEIHKSHVPNHHYFHYFQRAGLIMVGIEAFCQNLGGEIAGHRIIIGCIVTNPQPWDCVCNREGLEDLCPSCYRLSAVLSYPVFSHVKGCCIPSHRRRLDMRLYDFTGTSALLHADDLLALAPKLLEATSEPFDFF